MTFDFADLERAISVPRAGRYLAATMVDGAAPDPAAALALYEYNCRLSGAAWATIADIEITLRNIIAPAIVDLHAHERPSDQYRWYDEPSWFPPERKWFTPDTLASIETAKRRIRDPGPGSEARPHEGKFVAELTLGFWRYLLIARYEHTLWNPAIRERFDEALGGLSGSASRKLVHERVEALNYLRNRVAHHEPIYEPFRLPGRPALLDPGTVLREAISVIGWANPQASKWIDSRSAFVAVQATRPAVAGD